MPNTIVNTLLDTLGIIRAVAYRTFSERNWSSPQPMFNILQVKEGDDLLFQRFLKKSLDVSIKDNTPLSLGPFRTSDRTYIYITHYASTIEFIKVMKGLLFGGEARMRAKATLKTSWTYCLPNQTPELQATSKILMVGIKGNAEKFLDQMAKHSIQPLGLLKKIKDVRGHSLYHYVFFEQKEETESYLKEQIENGADICIYHAEKIK